MSNKYINKKKLIFFYLEKCLNKSFKKNSKTIFKNFHRKYLYLKSKFSLKTSSIKKK